MVLPRPNVNVDNTILDAVIKLDQAKINRATVLYQLSPFLHQSLNMTKIAIIHYSMYGHVATLSESIKKGVKAAGAEVCRN